MSSIGIDLAFGLVIIALVAASISAAMLAARHPSGWHTRWVVRSLALGISAIGTLVLWVAALAATPALA
jgi:hypothetical protein